REVAAIAKMPIMVTGGIRSKAVAEAALTNRTGGIGVSVLGMARALAFEPDLINQWKHGMAPEVTIPQVNWKNKRLAGFASMVLAYNRIERLALGKHPKAIRFPFLALLRNQLQASKSTKRYRKWREVAA
ncbi:MAG: 2,4-dienoyl-CoA reductase, partial [Pseudomonadota bacterium]